MSRRRGGNSDGSIRRFIERDNAQWLAQQRAINDDSASTPVARSWEEQTRTDDATIKVKGGHEERTDQDTTEFLLLPLDGTTGRHIVLSAEDGTRLHDAPHRNHR